MTFKWYLSPQIISLISLVIYYCNKNYAKEMFNYILIYLANTYMHVHTMF